MIQVDRNVGRVGIVDVGRNHVGTRHVGTRHGVSLHGIIFGICQGLCGVEQIHVMKRERKNIRLKNYDYASEGWYFVTICTKDRECFFGEINHDEMTYTEIGNQARLFWEEIPQHFTNVILDEYQIMPNHVHGLVGIVDVGTRDVPPNPNINSFGKTIPGSLSAIIGQFKSTLSRWCNKNNHSEFGWQSRFNDRIIRNEEEFYAIRNYIIANIANWNKD